MRFSKRHATDRNGSTRPKILVLAFRLLFCILQYVPSSGSTSLLPVPLRLHRHVVRNVSTLRTTHHASGHSKQSVSFISPIYRYHTKHHPTPVPERNHRDQAAPCNPNDVHQILRQAWRTQVFARTLQCLRGRIKLRSTGCLKDELSDEAGDREEEPRK